MVDWWFTQNFKPAQMLLSTKPIECSRLNYIAHWITLNKIDLQKIVGCNDLESLLKEPNCFKTEPGRVDLLLTNNKSYFEHSKTFVKGISGFYRFIVPSTKNNFVKSNPKIKCYQDDKHFDAGMFDKDLSFGLRTRSFIYLEF